MDLGHRQRDEAEGVIMRTLCVIYILVITGLAMVGNISRVKKDPAAAMVGWILNSVLIAAVIYLANTPE
jgi:hypothetical protein